MDNRTYGTILFDLDGTLTDSGPGIMRCAGIALRELGMEVPDPQQMRAFVGPPLSVTFRRFGVEEERIEEAIELFRRDYRVSGKWENHPYEGIAEMLAQLKEAGLVLLVATSKLETMAREILEKVALAPYFSEIAGATADGSRVNKDDVIRYLLDKTEHPGAIVMVGDTVFDIEGASARGLPAIGVSWGYGNVEEMKQAGAAAIVDTPQELAKKLLEKRFRVRYDN